MRQIPSRTIVTDRGRSVRLRDSICETLIKNGYKLSSEAPFPSVFQFRLGGYKGILAVDNTQEGIGIAVRPSQEKFLGLADTDEGDSFVLNIAEAFDKPRPLRLSTSSAPYELVECSLTAASSPQTAL